MSASEKLILAAVYVALAIFLIAAILTIPSEEPVEESVVVEESQVTGSMECVWRYAEKQVAQVYALVIMLQNNVAPDVALCSFYGEYFHGRETASGIEYDMYGMSVAHKTLPLGTRVLFVNWENMRVAVLRVEDRGPYVEGRDFDLSYGAFGYLTDGQYDMGLVSLNHVVLDRDTEGLRYF